LLLPSSLVLSVKVASVWQKFVILRVGKLHSVRGAEAIERVEQTSLREIIACPMPVSLLSDRRAADARLREQIGGKTEDWGVEGRLARIRDVAIPVAVQDAMFGQAQAEREKQARVILGSAEADIAAKFFKAAQVYENHPGALQLRAMNIIYEAPKVATILIPSSMVDSLNPPPALAIAAQGVAGGSQTPLKTAA
jgi:regulator of protease activity HflC (stomatin/prohibitin superfamily)